MASHLVAVCFVLPLLACVGPAEKPSDDPADTPASDDDCDEIGWFADADGDGYGNPDTELVACTPPEGHVADATDCDDSRADVHPDAAEVCDAVDQDCDGAVDERQKILS